MVSSMSLLPSVVLVLTLQAWAASCDACVQGQEDAAAGLASCPQGLQEEIGLVQLHTQITSIRDTSRHNAADLPKAHSRYEPPPLVPPPGRDINRWKARVQSFNEWSHRWIFGYSEYYGAMVMEIWRRLPGHRRTRPSYAFLEGMRDSGPSFTMLDGGQDMPVSACCISLFIVLVIGLWKWAGGLGPAASSGKDKVVQPDAAQLELRWWHVFVLMQLDCMTPVTQDAYIPSMPVMATQLHASESAVGLSLQVNWIFSGFIAFALGIASDKYGRRPALLVALTCYVVGAILCAISPNVEWLIAARCIQGIGGGSQALCYAIARDWIQDDQERSKLFSIFSIAATVAIAGAPIVGGLAAVVMGWRMVFVLLAAWGLLAFWNVLSTLPETNPKLTAEFASAEAANDTPAAGGSSFGPIVDVFYKSLRPLGLMVSMWMMMPILMSILSSMPFVLDNAFGAGTVTITWCSASLAIASLAGSALCFVMIRFLTSWQVMRFGMCGLLLVGVALLVFGLLQVPLTMISFMVLPSLYVGFLTTIMGPMRSLVAQPFGAAAGAANGLVMSLSGPVGALFGFFLTWVFQASGVFAWMVLLGSLATFHQASYWGLVGTSPEDDPIFEITEGYLNYLKSKGKGKGKK